MPHSNAPAIVQLMPLVFFVLIFYFLLIRPQQKKQKEYKKMRESVKKNDEVVTSGGIHGTVIGIKDKTFILRVDNDVKIEVDKVSLGYIKKKRDDKAV